MAARSLTAPSISFASRAASPTPMFTTILVSPGICITLAYPNSSFRAGAISVRYFSLSRGCAGASVRHQISFPLGRSTRTFLPSSLVW